MTCTSAVVVEEAILFSILLLRDIPFRRGKNAPREEMFPACSQSRESALWCLQQLCWIISKGENSALETVEVLLNEFQIVCFFSFYGYSGLSLPWTLRLQADTAEVVTAEVTTEWGSAYEWLAVTISEGSFCPQENTIFVTVVVCILYVT